MVIVRQLPTYFRYLLARFVGLVLMCGLFAAASSAQSDSQPTSAQDLYEKWRDGIFQVRIVNTRTGSTSALGSGFFISRDGTGISNFHVVSESVHTPDRYRVEFERGDGFVGNLVLLAVDVINDLAVVKAAEPVDVHFSFRGSTPRTGEHIFALGNPRDLGTTIVEGTYSGPVANSIYQRIHFTGSLNPGMSGGPTIDSHGHVVGINVATSGNQISFLVDANHAKALLARAPATAEGAPLKQGLRDQLFSAQSNFWQNAMGQPLETTSLGEFAVPAKFIPQLSCWGDSSEEDDQKYKILSQECSLRDYVYLSRQHSVEAMALRHDYYESDELNSLAFSHLYSDSFGDVQATFYGARDDVTGFRCRTDFVKNDGLNFRTAFCVRGLKEYPGLYDALLRVATITPGKKGLQSEFSMGAVSLENAIEASRRFIEAIQWNP